MEGVTVYGHPPECYVTFGRGGLILFDNIPVLTIELHLFRLGRKSGITIGLDQSRGDHT